MVSKATKMPYDKTKLTKSFKNLNYKTIELRDEDWYQSNGIDYMLGREVTYVDKTVFLFNLFFNLLKLIKISMDHLIFYQKMD